MRTFLVLLAFGLITTALPAVLAVPGVDVEAYDEKACHDGGSAWLGDAATTGVTLQIGGTQASIPNGFLQVAASLDGYFWQSVEFDCIRAYHFVATRHDAAGTSTVEVDSVRFLECATGEHWYKLPTPVDTTGYTLQLWWQDCQRQQGGDEDLAVVCDPPVTPLLATVRP